MISVAKKPRISKAGNKFIRQALTSLRWLLHAIYGMLKINNAFEGTRFYPLPVPSNSQAIL